MGYAYLEDYNIIKVISDAYNKNSKVRIVNENIELKLINKQIEGKFHHLYYETSQNLETNKDYQIMIDYDLINLHLGKITRSSLFDELNYYDGDLGFIYSKKQTTFKLWSPVSKEVKLVLPKLNKIYDLSYTFNGVYETTVKGNLDKQPYYYLVRINDEFIKTLDPYGIASSLKEEVNFVINKAKTYKFKSKNPSFSNYSTDNIIMEAHLKDLTYHLNEESNFLSSIKMIDYFKDLGITHVQLLPVNSFYGVDEEKKDLYYNWGYNPLEYMSLSGWYASKPSDPYNKINEFKELVDNYHLNNIGINLDVVFNHVYKHDMFSMGKIVPGYAYRCDQAGFLTNGSYCGNDLATERKMVRKLIIDTLKHYVEFYHIDGFRFDLMGLIDIETMKQIEKVLREMNPNLMLYGEGWVMPTGIKQSLLASSKEALPNIGYFNDTYRDFLRGNPFKLDKGILMGAKINKDQLTSFLKGSFGASQSINYIECHDNYTLNDQMDLVKKMSLDQKKDYLKLGLGLLMISQGIPFIHLGMEIGRTKNGIDNTYNESIEINRVDFSKINLYLDVLEYLKKMIYFRKENPVFRLTNKSMIDDLVKLVEYNNNYLVYQIAEYEIVITNTYDVFEYNLMLINKPGVYIFQNKKPY